MKRKVNEAQERLWGEDTVALGRDPEAKPERAEPTRQHRIVSTNQRRQRARALVGCAVALAFTAAAVAILGGNKGQRTAGQPAPSEIRSTGQRTEPRISVVRAPRPARGTRGHLRHRVAKRPRHHLKRTLTPTIAEPITTAPPMEPTESNPEVDTEPPASPRPETAAPAPPTSPSTEFGIEHGEN